MTFADLGLMPELLRAVADAGYTEPTPIQSKAIPLILQGADVLGGAQTGTGKTAGFTLPLLQRLARHANVSPSPARHPVLALILCPTRELAMQVHESVQTYGKHLALRSTVIYGGVDIKPQMAELRRGVEVVVATPGRLLDHVEQKTIMLNQVEVLVLDEADRMLDMGFIPDVKRILALLPRQRQSLLFSATFSNEIKKLADTMLRQPQLVEVAARNAVTDTVSHLVHPVAHDAKRALLAHLVRQHDLRQALVFVGTKFGTARLAHYLARQGLGAEAIHGDKSQQQRSAALEAFKSGTVRVLVATDVAARGLDIDDLPHVINYDLPHSAEDYVHRIGRTGRAGKSGEAISLVCADERGRLAEIEALMKRKIEQQVVPGFEPEPEFFDAFAKGKRGRRSAVHSPRSAPGEGTGKRERSRRSEPRPAATGRAAAGMPKPEFDWTKPYEPQAEIQPPLAMTSGRSRKPQRQVPALLGGLAKK